MISTFVRNGNRWQCVKFFFRCFLVISVTDIAKLFKKSTDFLPSLNFCEKISQQRELQRRTTHIMQSENQFEVSTAPLLRGCSPTSGTNFGKPWTYWLNNFECFHCVKADCICGLCICLLLSCTVVKFAIQTQNNSNNTNVIELMEYLNAFKQ